MKKLLLVLLGLFALVGNGCLDILGPQSEEEKEGKTYIRRLIISDSRMEGDVLIITPRYGFYPFDVKERMVKADTVEFQIYWPREGNLDTLITGRNTWAEEYRFSGYPKNNPRMVETFIRGWDTE